MKVNKFIGVQRLSHLSMRIPTLFIKIYIVHWEAQFRTVVIPIWDPGVLISSIHCSAKCFKVMNISIVMTIPILLSLEPKNCNAHLVQMRAYGMKA